MNSADSKAQLRQLGRRLLDMRMPLFVLFLLVIYGFVAWRAYTLTSSPPKASPSSGTSPAAPAPGAHIDRATVSKIKHLKDHSTTVKTLFNQARGNPFHE
jgi:hypothetical protein